MMIQIDPEIDVLIAQCALLLVASILILAAAMVALWPPVNRRKALRESRGRLPTAFDDVIERGFR